MKQGLSVILASMVLVFGLTAAVNAEDESTEQSDDISESREAREVERSREKREIREEVAERKTEKKESIAEKRAEVKARIETKKVELDLVKCERNKDRITKLMPKLATGATTQMRVLDTMYDRVVGFYENSALSLAESDYQELVEAIEQARTETEVSVEAMEASEVTVDCESDGMGNQLSEYRATVKDVKAGLKDYRGALVELIKSLKAADDTDASSGTTAETTEDDNTGSTSEGVN